MLARLALPVLLAAALPASAQTLLRDFETGPSDEVASSDPSAVVDVGIGGLFATRSYATGRELWITDATAAGTRLVADLNPGVEDSSPGELSRLPNGPVVFSAHTPQTGRELFVSDGSSQGTTLLRDIQPGTTGSHPSRLTLVGNRVFFFARTNLEGWELYTTDGTTAGTVLVDDLLPGPAGIVDGTHQMRIAPIGPNDAVFVVRSLGWELWRSDGTSAGTSLVTSLPGAFFTTAPDEFTPFGSSVLFRVWTDPIREAWITDGTPSGTFSLGAESEEGFVVAGSNAFFVNESFGAGEELYVTDGTVAGTQLVVDTTPLVDESSQPELLGAVGNELIYSTYEQGSVRKLYRSDGTAAGTTPLSDLAPYPQFNDARGHLHLGELWFSVPQNGGGIARTDGTPAGTVFVDQVLFPEELGSLGGILTFRGLENPAGKELWTSLGTPGTTGMVVDTTPPPQNAGSFVRMLGEFRNEAFFSVKPTGAGDDQLWATDGTPAGTRPVWTAGAPEFPLARPVFARKDEHFLFLADHETLGVEPHVSDGTTAGTHVIDLYPGNFGSNGYAAVTVNDTFLFTATIGQGQEFYVTDGTLAGTSLLADIRPGPFSSAPDDFLVHDLGAGERLFFTADNGIHGREPWVTDGTTAGTGLLLDCLPGPDGQQFTEFGALPNVVVFSADDGVFGRELWATDGTPGGTQLLADVEPGPLASSPSSFHQLGPLLFFLAETGGQTTLWSTDGTGAGTLPFAGLPLPPKSPLFRVNDTRAVLWLGDVATDELWVIDSTIFQPQLVRVFDANNVAYQPLVHRPIGEGHLVFAADDGVGGEELWTTDGTPAGTYRVTDFPISSGEPREMARAGDQIVFRADDGVHGYELFSVDLVDAGAWVAEVYGTGCPGTGGVVPDIVLSGEARASSPLPFEVLAVGAAPNAPAFLLWSREPGAQAVPGCTLWLDGFLHVEVAATDAAGVAGLTVLPNPGLVGQRFDSQWFVLDPAGTAFGVASATAALELVVGP